MTIISLDLYTSHLDPIKKTVFRSVQWIYHISQYPNQLSRWLTTSVKLNQVLLHDNSRLKLQNKELIYQSNRYHFLLKENNRLRELLKASKKRNYDTLLAEVVSESVNRYSNMLSINKGHKDRLFIGQPILGLNGIVGQVVEVYDSYSNIMLITDISHKMSLEIERSNKLVIAEGDGTELSLRYLPITFDIKEGDILVASGLGGVFPRGYPVALIKTVQRRLGYNFLLIEAEPIEDFQSLYEVLVLF